MPSRHGFAVPRWLSLLDVFQRNGQLPGILSVSVLPTSWKFSRQLWELLRPAFGLIPGFSGSRRHLGYQLHNCYHLLAQRTGTCWTWSCPSAWRKDVTILLYPPVWTKWWSTVKWGWPLLLTTAMQVHLCCMSIGELRTPEKVPLLELYLYNICDFPSRYDFTLKRPWKISWERRT